MQSFGPTDTHGTAFAPKQSLYQKEDTGMDSSKMFCPSWCRNSTYQCGSALVRGKTPSTPSVRGSKLPHLMGGSIVLGMEICETSGLPIPIVLRLHQSNGTSMESTNIYYHTRCKKPYLPLQGHKLFCFIGGSIGPRMGLCETLGLLIPMVPRFHRTNVYIKWKLRVWRSQKGIALVGAETVLISAGPL